MSEFKFSPLKLQILAAASRNSTLTSQVLTRDYGIGGGDPNEIMQELVDARLMVARPDKGWVLSESGYQLMQVLIGYGQQMCDRAISAVARANALEEPLYSYNGRVD